MSDLHRDTGILDVLTSPVISSIRFAASGFKKINTTANRHGSINAAGRTRFHTRSQHEEGGSYYSKAVEATTWLTRAIGAHILKPFSLNLKVCAHRSYSLASGCRCAQRVKRIGAYGDANIACAADHHCGRR